MVENSRDNFRYVTQNQGFKYNQAMSSVVCKSWYYYSPTKEHKKWVAYFNINVKVVPVLFLTELHTMKAYWGSRCIAPPVLDLGTR
jgi:hypothetical protein